MNHRSRSKKLFYAALLFASFGCTTQDDLKPDGVTAGVPIQRVFYGDNSDIQGALRAAMKKYPVRIDNLDAGVFETDDIKGDKMFKSATQTSMKSASGIHYRILIQAIKGKVDGRPATRVVIKKILEKSRDFFSEPLPLPSDGLEENVIFYRIQRELSIAKALKRAHDRPSSNS